MFSPRCQIDVSIVLLGQRMKHYLSRAAASVCIRGCEFLCLIGPSPSDPDPENAYRLPPGVPSSFITKICRTLGTGPFRMKLTASCGLGNSTACSIPWLIISILRTSSLSILIVVSSQYETMASTTTFLTLRTLSQVKREESGSFVDVLRGVEDPISTRVPPVVLSSVSGVLLQMVHKLTMLHDP